MAVCTCFFRGRCYEEGGWPRCNRRAAAPQHAVYDTQVAACSVVTQLRQLGPSAPGGRLSMEPPEEAQAACSAQSPQARPASHLHDCHGRSHGVLASSTSAATQATLGLCHGSWRFGLQQGVWRLSQVLQQAQWWLCRLLPAGEMGGRAAGGGGVPGAGRASLHACQAGDWPGALGAAAGIVASWLAPAGG